MPKSEAGGVTGTVTDSTGAQAGKEVLVCITTSRVFFAELLGAAECFLNRGGKYMGPEEMGKDLM
jgi:hypothetical protein